MNILATLFPALREHISALITIALVVAGFFVANWLLLHRKRDLTEESRFPRRIIVFLLAVLGIVLILIALPVEEGTRSGLFTLFGLLLLTAVIALSSTMFVANAMAGWMLRAVRSFKPGDFVRVGQHFGRVTERAYFR